MLIDNTFDVPGDVERVWSYLLDVEKVVPCMPGAELTEVVDERNWKGKVKIKLGPVGLSFAGKVTMAERDDTAHRVVLKGSGMEQRGKGAASATVTTTAEPAASGTRVKVVQDLQVQGQAAQMARGMMQDVTSRLTKEFADCLKANLESEDVEAVETPAPADSHPERAELAGSAASSGARYVAGTGHIPGSARPSPKPPSPRVVAKPVSGIRLAFGALVGALGRLFIRLRERLNRAG